MRKLEGWPSHISLSLPSPSLTYADICSQLLGPGLSPYAHAREPTAPIQNWHTDFKPQVGARLLLIGFGCLFVCFPGLDFMVYIMALTVNTS